MSQITSNQAADRKLHMTPQGEEFLKKVRAFAIERGIEDKLDAGLEYARTFSGGPEAHWATHFGPDIGANVPNNPSFCFTVYRRAEPYSSLREHLIHYMTIGMIWFERDGEWSFHS